jgi:hypothetical protein
VVSAVSHLVEATTNEASTFKSIIATRYVGPIKTSAYLTTTLKIHPGAHLDAVTLEVSWRIGEVARLSTAFHRDELDITSFRKRFVNKEQNRFIDWIAIVR